MTSLIFPGQGSQYVGMAKDFNENFTIAKNTFDEIEDYVQINIRKIIFENENDNLNLTKFTQLSIFATSISIFRTYASENGIDIKKINLMLGHSLGEYSALVCSNKLDLKDASLILKKRGDLMQNAVEPNQSGMAALIGCNAQDISEIIIKNKINLEIANDNSPIQIVVSGAIEEIDKNKEIFLKNNVKKYIKLNVSAAFHSKYMFDAQNLLNKDIDKLKFIDNDVGIISNYNAELTKDNLRIKDALKKQMANRVRWTESVNKLLNVGETKVIEIGPGKVLSGLVKRISSSFDITSINEVSDIVQK